MLVHTVHELPSSLPLQSRVVALGRFDGVHLGHRAVITAASTHLRPAPHTDVLSVFTLSGMAKEDDLCDREGFLRHLKEAGADELIEMDFALARTLSPEAFVHAFLRDTLHATAVVCGFNFRFGTDRSGDTDTLKALCAQAGIAVQVVPAVRYRDEPISSSRIRRCLKEGNVLQANRMLGYPFTLRFPVVSGQRLGRKLGFPTINQRLPSTFIRPRFGVYASAVVVDGKVTWGVTNIGIHPTVGKTEPVAETGTPAFSGNLYGQCVPVTPVCFLREEHTFSSLDELTAQVRQDGEDARHAIQGDALPHAAIPRRCRRAVLFDFDDTLQDRHLAFLAYARWLTARYFPAWPSERQEAEAQRMMRENNGGYKADGTPLNYPRFFAETAQRLGADALPDVPTLQRDYARIFPQHTHPFSDAAAVLTALKARGFLVGVITNGNPVIQSRKLDHSGLRPLLDITVISGCEGVRKPDPEIFRRTAAYLGVDPAACVYVGDHPTNDVYGAKSAGMRYVYLDAFEEHACADTPRVTSLTELLQQPDLS